MNENDAERFLRMLAFLSYSFEVPAPAWVDLTPDNPILTLLAPIDQSDDVFDAYVQWLESIPPDAAMHHLRRDYAQLFVLPDAPASVYLHRLMDDVPPEETLQNWVRFLHQVQRAPDAQWHEGPDHLTLVFELLASLFMEGDERWVPLAESFVLPWLPSFSTTLKENASTPFYKGVGVMAGEVNHALDSTLSAHHSDSVER